MDTTSDAWEEVRCRSFPADFHCEGPFTILASQERDAILDFCGDRVWGWILGATNRDETLQVSWMSPIDVHRWEWIAVCIKNCKTNTIIPSRMYRNGCCASVSMWYVRCLKILNTVWISPISHPCHDQIMSGDQIHVGTFAPVYISPHPSSPKLEWRCAPFTWAMVPPMHCPQMCVPCWSLTKFERCGMRFKKHSRGGRCHIDVGCAK